MPDNYFAGPERLEIFISLGAVMRMGLPSSTRTTDHSAFQHAVSSGRIDEAQRYLEMMRHDQTELLCVLGEWSLQLPRTLLDLVGAKQALATHAAAYPRFQKQVASLKTSKEAAKAVAIITGVLIPALDSTEAGQRCRSAPIEGKAIPLDALLAAVTERHLATHQLLASNDADAALKAFFNYANFIRIAHDAWVQFIDAFGAEVLKRNGQSVVENLIRQSFSACSFFEPLWMAGQLPSKELAAFLAAHIRAHFSGDARGGGVEVIEDEEKYRLVFDACGSGGAMRRRLAAAGNSALTLPNATPATWMRAHEVPPYCAHCAFNELESIRRFGYPKLVTEFDPNPNKPCGWTIYKHAERIPGSYYERLGLAKPETVAK